ncbi:hypothetical protein [Microbacterium lacticum]|uniref:hypothetical protein n=1 Tax=Microbacterium lacticum TaxID=33885 RepID=UPI00188B7785|nr:hypothetical protein [Microbacterium lacticum]
MSDMSFTRYDTGDPDEYFAVCPDCNGDGQAELRTGPEGDLVWGTCPFCDGRGHVSADPEDFL